MPAAFGGIAQLGERLVRNQKVGGSIPPVSTKDSNKKATLRSGLFAAWLRSGRQDFSPPVMLIPDTG